MSEDLRIMYTAEGLSVHVELDLPDGRLLARMVGVASAETGELMLWGPSIAYPSDALFATEPAPVLGEKARFAEEAAGRLGREVADLSRELERLREAKRKLRAIEALTPLLDMVEDSEACTYWRVGHTDSVPEKVSPREVTWTVRPWGSIGLRLELVGTGNYRWFLTREEAGEYCLKQYANSIDRLKALRTAGFPVPDAALEKAKAFVVEASKRKVQRLAELAAEAAAELEQLETL